MPVSTVSRDIVFDGMVEKPSVWAFQNFNQIENCSNIKKAKMCMSFVLTVLTEIALNALEILMSCINSIDIHQYNTKDKFYISNAMYVNTIDTEH